jgi:uncharacterized protein YbaR (Trm112 family)
MIVSNNGFTTIKLIKECIHELLQMKNSPLSQELYSILVCPVCKHKIAYTKNYEGLECKPCKSIYPITNGIPQLLPIKNMKIQKMKTRGKNS